MKAPCHLRRKLMDVFRKWQFFKSDDLLLRGLAVVWQYFQRNLVLLLRPPDFLIQLERAQCRQLKHIQHHCSCLIISTDLILFTRDNLHMYSLPHHFMPWMHGHRMPYATWQSNICDLDLTCQGHSSRSVSSMWVKSHAVGLTDDSTSLQVSSLTLQGSYAV